MARRRPPVEARGWAQDIARAARGYTTARTRARQLGYDVEWMKGARKITAASNLAIFNTKGASADYTWKRADRDFVDTGRLKLELTTPGALRARVMAKRINFGAFSRHFQHWANFVSGFSESAKEALAAHTAEHLAALANGDGE